MAKNNRIEITVEHATDGRTTPVKALKSTTGDEIIEGLIEEDFIKPIEEGYGLYVKGGADINNDKPLSDQEVEEGDTVKVVPASDAGG